MSDMRSLIEKLTAISEDRPTIGDGVYLEFSNILQVDTEIMEMDNESITLLGDEKLLGLLESLGAIETKYLGEAKLWRERDFGGNNYVKHYRDDYFIATSGHESDDVRKTNYHLLKKVVKTDDEMTPAYEEITTLNVSPYSASREDINQAAERAIAQKGSVAEGEVVSMQDNHQTLKRLAKMWWHGDEGKHAQAVKMLSNMGWDIDEDDDDIVLNKGDKEVRFFMDDLYESIVAEAEYHGRKVPLGKPMRGDVKKFKVFVKDPKTGNVKKVNFGDKKMRIKKSNPKRRKSFRARHNCANPGPRTKARYWSCRKW
jgi:hypothetical protein